MEPMNAEERFEKIETALLATQGLLRTVVESQVHTQQTIGDVIGLFNRYIEVADARMTRIEQGLDTMGGNVNVLGENIARYVDAADVRMRRIEENLDGLIRAITAEHTNGKSEQ